MRTEPDMPSPFSDLRVAPLPELALVWNQRLRRQLPWPSHGEQSLFVGDPLLVMVSFGPEQAEVSQPLVEWVSPATPRLRMRPVGEIPLHERHYDHLQQLVEKTAWQRLRAFRECSRCGRRLAPERLASLAGQPACRDCLIGRRILF